MWAGPTQEVFGSLYLCICLPLLSSVFCPQKEVCSLENSTRSTELFATCQFYHVQERGKKTPTTKQNTTEQNQLKGLQLWVSTICETGVAGTTGSDELKNKTKFPRQPFGQRGLPQGSPHTPHVSLTGLENG